MLLVYYLASLAAFFPITVLTSYLISTLLGHTEADFPYISDTGTTVPESCIFGQMLNICAVLFAMIVYFRYLQVNEYAKSFNLPYLSGHNVTCLISGWTAAFGISIVANFQETSVFVMHMIGAFLAFLNPIIYMACETVITFRTAPMAAPKWIGVVRAGITVLYITSFILTTTFSYIAPVYYTGTNYQLWEPSDGGWEYHVVSTAFEWALGILIVLFLVTYHKEFHDTHILTPVVKLGPSLTTSKNSEAAFNYATREAATSESDTNELTHRSALKVDDM